MSSRHGADKRCSWGTLASALAAGGAEQDDFVRVDYLVHAGQAHRHRGLCAAFGPGPPGRGPQRRSPGNGSEPGVREGSLLHEIYVPWTKEMDGNDCAAKA
jgi:hypothetical protein